jgi:hypothetical protein
VFDVRVAAAVWAEFREISALADVVLLDLGAVAGVEKEFDLPGFVDDIQRHCWISGCRLRLTTTHPSLLAALAGQGVSSSAAGSGSHGRTGPPPGGASPTLSRAFRDQ